MSEQASDRERVEALAKVIDGEVDGTIITRAEHHPNCDGSCRECPIPVQDYGDPADLARAVLASPAMRDLLAEAKADALREAADDMWRIFLRLPNTPSPLGDHIQRLVADYRDRAANPYRETEPTDD